MTDIEKITTESLITQWKQFSGYIEKLDTEHWHVFTIVFAALGLFSLVRIGDEMSIIYWIIPLTIMILFYYEAYRLREIAIMKGFLARIEKTINSRLQNNNCANTEEVFNWYYC